MRIIQALAILACVVTACNSATLTVSNVTFNRLYVYAYLNYEGETPSYVTYCIPPSTPAATMDLPVCEWVTLLGVLVTPDSTESIIAWSDLQACNPQFRGEYLGAEDDKWLGENSKVFWFVEDNAFNGYVRFDQTPQPAVSAMMKIAGLFLAFAVTSTGILFAVRFLWRLFQRLLGGPTLRE